MILLFYEILWVYNTLKIQQHEASSLAYRTEQRLREFENKVLRNIHGARRYEITGEWKKLYTVSYMYCTLCLA